MRAGSTDPFCIAVSTAPAKARARASMSAPAAVDAVITCQPASRVQFCHWTVSAGSSSATAGDFICPASGQQRNRLIVAHPRTNSFRQFLDIIRFFDSRDGEDVAIVLFQVDLQLLGQIRQFGSILEVLLVLGLEDFVLLRLAVR